MVAIIVLAGFMSYPTIKEIKRNKQINKEIETLQGEAEDIRANNSILSEEISYFETDEYKERIAKEKLSLQKDGEKVVIVKPSVSREEEYIQEEVQVENDGSLDSDSGISNYRKWWSYFFQY